VNDPGKNQLIVEKILKGNIVDERLSILASNNHTAELRVVSMPVFSENKEGQHIIMFMLI
jgi:hypothetical protein